MALLGEGLANRVRGRVLLDLPLLEEGAAHAVVYGHGGAEGAEAAPAADGAKEYPTAPTTKRHVASDRYLFLSCSVHYTEDEEEEDAVPLFTCSKAHRSMDHNWPSVIFCSLESSQGSIYRLEKHGNIGN